MYSLQLFFAILSILLSCPSFAYGQASCKSENKVIMPCCKVQDKSPSCCNQQISGLKNSNIKSAKCNCAIVPQDSLPTISTIATMQHNPFDSYGISRPFQLATLPLPPFVSRPPPAEFRQRPQQFYIVHRALLI